MTWHKRTDWGSTPLPQGVQTQHPAPRIRTSCLVEIIQEMENNNNNNNNNNKDELPGGYNSGE